MASTSRSRSSGSRRKQTTRRKNSGSSSRKNPSPKPASAPSSAPASAPSGLEKALPYIGVGTMTATGINAWKNKEHNDWLKNHPFTPAAGPSGSEPAVNPDDVKVNPKDVKTQGETGTPAPSSSGTVSTGRDPKAEPQNDTGVGVNQSTEQTRQENLKADPESSGLAWGVRQGGRYADATNRAVTNNDIAAGQQAYFNQNNMPTARQSSMDFEAQMQDRNSPLFRQLDRMSGGLYTKQLEWQEKQRGPAQKPSEPASGQKPQAQPSVPAQVKTQGGETVPQFNVATAGTGGNASPSASPFSFKNYLSEWTKAQAGTGTPASEPPTPPVAPLDVNDPSAQQSLADAGLNADGNPIPEFAPIGSRAEGRELQRDQTASNLTLGAIQDTSQFADESVRISAALKADGLKNTLLARSDLSGLKNALPKNASMGAKLGRGVNRGMAGLNLAGGLAAGWE